MKELVVTTEQEFKSAIENKVSRIRLNNKDIANQVKLLKKVPTASYAAASVLLGTVIVNLLTLHTEVVTGPLTGGTSTVIRFGHKIATTTIIVSMLGLNTTLALLALGVSLGGIGLLSSVYNNYKIVENHDTYIVLVRE